MLTFGFLSTYYIVTRSILLALILITSLVLIYRGKFHKIDEASYFGILALISLMLLPQVGEFIVLLLAILMFGWLLHIIISAFNKISKTRELAIRAESTKDMPSSGQVSLAAAQDGQLTLVEKMENNERELQRIRDRLGRDPMPSDIISSLLRD